MVWVPTCVTLAPRGGWAGTAGLGYQAREQDCLEVGLGGGAQVPLGGKGRGW